MFENILLQTALRQMAVLGLFVALGFILAKCKVIPKEANKTLSKLESFAFIPALVMGKFITNFTKETISTAWKLLLFSLLVELAIIPIALLLARLMSPKDDFLRKICIYGLSFSNFGFMGLPMIEALFPQYILHYVIFSLPLWALNFGWGVPFLLMDRKDQKKGLGPALKNLINPIFIGLLIGALIGVLGIKLPSFAIEVIETCGACMSPIAMMITGITFAGINLKKVLSNHTVYIATGLRLLIFPCLFGGIYLLITHLLGIQPAEYFYICLVCCAALPLGLNSVVIPAGYGKDTSVAAGMVLVSHLLSVATIPLILTIFL
jgi:predicted permease